MGLPLSFSSSTSLLWFVAMPVGMCARMASSSPRRGNDAPVTMKPIWALFDASCAPARQPARRRGGGEAEQYVAVFHSMTPSARARIDCGILRPSAVAVLKLTTSSNQSTAGPAGQLRSKPPRLAPVRHWQRCDPQFRRCPTRLTPRSFSSAVTAAIPRYRRRCRETAARNGAFQGCGARLGYPRFAFRPHHYRARILVRLVAVSRSRGASSSHGQG